MNDDINFWMISYVDLCTLHFENFQVYVASIGYSYSHIANIIDFKPGLSFDFYFLQKKLCIHMCK